MEGYTAFVLTDEARERLLKKFPPKYPEFIGHHVTVSYGVPSDTLPPEPSQIHVIGYKDTGDGLEALVVSVNGNRTRPDGKTYHITWSLDRTKYKPVDSNFVLSNGRYTLIKSIPITTVPQTL